MKAKLNESDGLAAMRGFIKEFLAGGEGTPEVREYMSSIIENDALLLIYLKGRKYRAKHAWETLKRKAEVSLNEYPECFPENPPDEIFPLMKKGFIGVLKNRDKFGRRILYIHAGKYEPKELSMEQLTAAGAYFMEKALLDDDVMNNGIVLIQDCAGMGLKHAKAYSINALVKQVQIFCHACPIKFKGAYYLNVPFFAPYLMKLLQPFLSKKLKERFTLLTSDQKFAALHETMPPHLLPKFLGGTQENEGAFDLDIFGLNPL